MKKYYFVKVATFWVAAIVAIRALILPISAAAAYKKVEYVVPAGNSYFKSYMSYKAITNKASPQYKLQQQAYTDENGLRKIDDYYMVAMGTYYVDEIGDKFVIQFDTGEEINAIAADIKADKDTDETNRYRNVYDNNGNFISKDIVEFVVDINALDKTAKNWGTISAIDGFEGNVSAIYKLEETNCEKE